MSEKLRVLMISEYPFSDKEQGRGGILQSTFHLIEGFNDLGALPLDLHLISQTPACNRYESRLLDGVTLHFVPRGEGELDKFLINPLRLFISFLTLRQSLRPHIVHGQGSPIAILLSQYFGRKNIQTIHGIYRNEQLMLPRDGVSVGRRIRMRINEMVERHYLRKVQNLISITSEIRRLVDSATIGRARIFPSYIAIDPVFFRTVDRCARNPRDDFVILFVAAITPRKGLHFLLDAFEKLYLDFPGIKLRIVGMWDWAPDYVAELHTQYRVLITLGRLVFTGGVGRDQLFEEYANADLFVLPSLSESAPAVVSQAMCMSLPLIATRVGGVPEMVDDNVTGLLVEPGSAAAIERALRSLLEDPVARSRLAEAARKTALNRYLPRAVAATTLDAYKAAVSDSP